jgi:hypothetical protein
MKDLKYLILLICFVIFAHATKKYSSERTEAKFLPDIPDSREQKKLDSLRTEASAPVKLIPAALYD